MFFKLVMRNSRRNRRENALFMSSMIISVIAFYVVLSLENQDVIRFLKTLEGDAVIKLLALTGGLYIFTLVVLFFMIYYASRYQIERRNHELGVYLMMGMRKSRLLLMLLAEEVTGSLISLAVGVPAAVLLTELMSLMTVKLVGIGFIGHQTTFSIRACLMTCIGFFVIKLAAFIIISFKLAGKEIGTLLADAPENARKQRHVIVYVISLILGSALLISAYCIASSGMIWNVGGYMGIMVICGLAGTFLLFYGMRVIIDRIARSSKGAGLRVFSFRQVQDTVVCRSGTMAVCSLLILFAAVCLSAGIGFYTSYDLYGEHIADYTFFDYYYDGNNLSVTREKIERLGLSDDFRELLPMRVGMIRTWDDMDTAFSMEEVIDAMDLRDPGYDLHDNYIRYEHFPHLIALSDYNAILERYGKEPLDLADDEIAIYIDNDFCNEGSRELYDSVLSEGYRARIAEDEYSIFPYVQTTPFAMDYVLTLSLGVIIPDGRFEEYTCGEHDTYVNGFLSEDLLSGGDVFNVYSEINAVLDTDQEIEYSCYSENMGRQLFYLVAASYTLLYLAVIFCVIGNTILGVQFLMGQKKSRRRYITLVKLGATFEALCRTSGKQIEWYFGIPLAVASMSSIFGVRSLYQGTLSSRTMSNMNAMLLTAGIVIIAFCLIECIYIWVVKRSSYSYLRTLMTPDREE